MTVSGESGLPPSVGAIERALLAEIAASSNDAIIAKDLFGIVTSWNAAAEHLFGFTAAEMVGQPILRIIPPDRVEEEALILQRMHQGERLTHFETERLTRDGRRIPVSITISPIRDESGAIVGASKIARDLSEQHRLNAELQRRGALLQSILDTVPDGLVVIDKAGVVQFFSHAAERMFGYTAEQIIGNNVSLLMPDSHSGAHDGYLERYVRTGERRIIGIGRVVVGRRSNGSVFPMELQVGETVVDGSFLFTGFVRDLTERQDHERRLAELQSELIHVSRLSELGQMVSALAHEVNQPLTALANYIGGARRLLTAESPPALRRAIEKMGEQAARAHAIVQSLRGLLKKEARSVRDENLQTMIQETSALALLGTSRGIHLDLHLAPEATYARVDKVQIQQVLLNLMRNAVEAMAGLPNRSLVVSTSKTDDWVEISVADNGPGLAETVQARLFQPFVTTKPDGLGVGLSICRTIVEAHGGRLSAVSEVGKGTVFRFTVPAAGAAAGPAADAASTSGPD